MTIIQAFEESGLIMEFVETLVNDTDIPEKVRRQIWTLASTLSDVSRFAAADIAASFEDSSDEGNLTERWDVVVARYWPLLPDCPLKREIDQLER